jgi:hypothetical protein
MKPIFYLFVSLYSCNLPANDDAKNFIPGTYTRHYTDEYTDSYDTILIRQNAINTYILTKKSKYKKISDQNCWVAGSEEKKWLGTYDEGTGTLFLPSNGKTIFFDLKNRELNIGAEPYKKIKL